jgi:hypothetical protein
MSATSPAPTCEWCGHPHQVIELCTKRPRWSRRGFLALAGAALVGCALPDMPALVSGDFESEGGWKSFAIKLDYRFMGAISPDDVVAEGAPLGVYVWSGVDKVTADAVKDGIKKQDSDLSARLARLMEHAVNRITVTKE